ncbi:hypothetical protein HGP16_26215 [Rhizobium sp. P40RR-XXII]|uniref:hypothetical protein n=1 Tax=unclassified Rhizobium TaxID=2613769 RepID=UPI00145655CA|nr:MULTISPECIES: hypothetical protein [unclassified Rhizobium]NLR85379.1 hypothetical protein [Rhizobium sp. P28RR-XV]NLS20036.1 hypothetical protein [Rhizobium sp. P40RR-XXII]
MRSTNLPPKEDARLCAGVIREIAATKGIARDAVAIGKLTTCVAKLYSKGMRDRAQLLSAALEAFDASTNSTAEQAIASDVTHPR